MNAVKTIVFVIAVGALVWGCVEELEPESNLKPMVWFDRGPDEGAVVFQNSVTFEWTATDWDDDLGMGATYIRLEPSSVPWYDEASGDTVYFTHPEGWVRLYETIYTILDLPDSTFYFSVRVTDGRDADSTITRKFFIRYDAQPPIITNVHAPAGKPSDPNFCWTYNITAHDVARTPRAATPADSLEFTYRFVPPPPLSSIEPDVEWSTENKEFDVCIDGQNYPGEYKYRCKVRDRAGNTSPEKIYKFKIER